MSNESKKEVEVTSKKELTAEEQAELRAKKKAARKKAMKDRDMLALSSELQAKLDKEGKVAKLANIENVPMWKSRGYEILENPEHESSDAVYGAKSATGGIEVPVSKTDSKAKAVWMVTDKENQQILREIEDEQAVMMESQIGKGGSFTNENGTTTTTLPGRLTKV